VTLRLEHGLLFTTVVVYGSNRSISLDTVLVDTGSCGTVLSVERVAEIGLREQPGDVVLTIRGVGGTESVFCKTVERIEAGDMAVERLEIEVGAMDYGIEMDGILGLDFLLAVGAQLDLDRQEMSARPQPLSP